MEWLVGMNHLRECSEMFGNEQRADFERCRKALPHEIGTQLVAVQLVAQKTPCGVQDLLAVPKHDRDVNFVGLLH
jgi:hypothetical protein